MASAAPFDVMTDRREVHRRMQPGRMGWSPIAAVVATAVLVGVGVAGPPSLAAPNAPVLRSASALHGRVLVTFTVADLQPWLIEVAASSQTEGSGAFRSDAVRLREVITARPDPSTGLVRWRATKPLAPGTYFVHVSGIETDGVMDCRSQARECIVHWSSSRRLLIP